MWGLNRELQIIVLGLNILKSVKLTLYKIKAILSSTSTNNIFTAIWKTRLDPRILGLLRACHWNVWHKKRWPSDSQAVRLLPRLPHPIPQGPLCPCMFICSLPHIFAPRPPLGKMGLRKRPESGLRIIWTGNPNVPVPGEWSRKGDIGSRWTRPLDLKDSSLLRKQYFWRKSRSLKAQGST